MRRLLTTYVLKLARCEVPNRFLARPILYISIFERELKDSQRTKMLKCIQVLVAASTFFSSVATWAQQTECDTISAPLLLQNSYFCRWSFFTLDKPVHGTVIQHNWSETGCGTLAFASITIVKTEQDTIRILELCNQTQYPVGQKIKITKGANPMERDNPYQVHLPCGMFIEGERIYFKTKKEARQAKRKARKEKPAVLAGTWTCGPYDQTILKTAWGDISITF
jgi:hypothetical protein